MEALLLAAARPAESMEVMASSKSSVVPLRGSVGPVSLYTDWAAAQARASA